MLITRLSSAQVQSLSAAAGTDADLQEPLLGREAEDAADASKASTGAGQHEEGWGTLTTHRGEAAADWAAFVQTLVVQCVQGCRSLLGALFNAHTSLPALHQVPASSTRSCVR